MQNRKWEKLKKMLLLIQLELEERNGLPYCKNCGMDFVKFIKLIEEAFEYY
jgi:hypothetical protein